MNPDFLAFLTAMLQAHARFLVVGAHALAVHGTPRATGDMDVWIERTAENAERVWRAFLDFGVPATALGVAVDDLVRPDVVVQVGLPPRRIDVLTDLTGVEFATAWDGREVRQVAGIPVPFIGREALVRNKRATGRYKDLADLEALGEEPTGR